MAASSCRKGEQQATRLLRLRRKLSRRRTGPRDVARPLCPASPLQGGSSPRGRMSGSVPCTKSSCSASSPTRLLDFERHRVFRFQEDWEEDRWPRRDVRRVGVDLVIEDCDDLRLYGHRRRDGKRSTGDHRLGAAREDTNPPRRLLPTGGAGQSCSTRGTEGSGMPQVEPYRAS